MWKIHDWNYKLVIANNYLIKSIEHNFFPKNNSEHLFQRVWVPKGNFDAVFIEISDYFWNYFFNWKSISGSAISDKCNANFSLCSLILHLTKFIKQTENDLKSWFQKSPFLIYEGFFDNRTTPIRYNFSKLWRIKSLSFVLYSVLQ